MVFELAFSGQLLYQLHDKLRCFTDGFDSRMYWQPCFLLLWPAGSVGDVMNDKNTRA